MHQRRYIPRFPTISLYHRLMFEDAANRMAADNAGLAITTAHLP